MRRGRATRGRRPGRDPLARPADVVDSGEHGEGGAVGDLAGELEPPGSDHAEVDRQPLLRAVRERDPVEREQIASSAQLLPVQETAQAVDALANCPERRARHQPHLAEPERHPEADTRPEAPRVEPRERRRLHREQCRVPCDRRGDAEPDRHLLGGVECRGDAGERAREEAVLREPELAEAELLGPSARCEGSARAACGCPARSRRETAQAAPAPATRPRRRRLCERFR